MCVQINDYKEEVTIKTDESLMVYFMDPSLDLVSLKENHGHVIATTKDFTSR